MQLCKINVKKSKGNASIFFSVDVSRRRSSKHGLSFITDCTYNVYISFTAHMLHRLTAFYRKSKYSH